MNKNKKFIANSLNEGQVIFCSSRNDAVTGLNKFLFKKGIINAINDKFYLYII